MTLVVNKHVERIRRYQPFDVDSTEMIYELQADRSNPLYPVVTLDYLLEIIERPATKTVVLTGDAGHGKTSLCASLLARLRSDTETISLDIQKNVSQDLADAGDARHPVGHTRSGRPLYILRDLSENSLQTGATMLVGLLKPDEDGVAIICANEGQLRKCVAEDDRLNPDANSRARIIIQTLTEGIERGQVCDRTGSLYVINLNYQSVAPDSGEGLIPWALRTWTHGNRWKACESCAARHVCPILANRTELSEPARGPQRRTAVRNVFAAAERTGAVITTRQALTVSSFMLTGGLACKDVHAKYQRSQSDTSWQAPHVYHQALFGDLLTQQQRRSVPAFLALRKIDPGKVSRRTVDDLLDPEGAGRFVPSDPSRDLQKVRTARDAARQAERLRRLYTFLRRADFFDSEDTSDLFARMGLLAGDEFVSVSGKNLDEIDTETAVRDRFLKGLEAVQGIHRAGNNPDFFVLDPAFFAHRARAGVISRKVSSKNVRVVNQTTQWSAEGRLRDLAPEMQNAVEWLNRAIYIRIPALDPDHGDVSVDASLLRFELLTRWAAGLRSEVQHEAEIRGLTGALADLADSTPKDDEIQVLVGNVTRKLMIDVGNKIRSVNA